jgi:hypothetical protein
VDLFPPPPSFSRIICTLTLPMLRRGYVYAVLPGERTKERLHARDVQQLVAAWATMTRLSFFSETAMAIPSL